MEAGRLRLPELLAPAGDPERLRFAVAYGADAVYLGADRYGMRAGAKNFDLQQLAWAADFAHGYGRKVYLTVNTLPTNAEMDALPPFLEAAAASGVDAFIVADLGVLTLARRMAPGMPVHFSTQVGIMNYAAAQAAYEMGATRVVLARELSLEEIAEIRARTPAGLQLEVFVHGAMCVSVSGRCLLSRYLTGRDANRGECAQPCRWAWELKEPGPGGRSYPIGQEDGGSYVLNADDLCTAPFLNAIIETGVDSLKIEGRAKSFYYVASVTSAYRRTLDAWAAAPQAFCCPEEVLDELTRTSHRHYSTGFYFGPQGATQSTAAGGYQRSWDVVGVVEDWNDGLAACTQRGKFCRGDELEILMPGGEVFLVRSAQIFDGDGNELDSVPRAMMPFWLAVPHELPPMSILRRRCAKET